MMGDGCSFPFLIHDDTLFWFSALHCTSTLLDGITTASYSFSGLAFILLSPTIEYFDVV